MEQVPLTCTFGSPLDLHVHHRLSLQGPVDLDQHQVQGGGGAQNEKGATSGQGGYITPTA